MTTAYQSDDHHDRSLEAIDADNLLVALIAKVEGELTALSTRLADVSWKPEKKQQIEQYIAAKRDEIVAQLVLIRTAAQLLDGID